MMSKAYTKFIVYTKALKISLVSVKRSDKYLARMSARTTYIATLIENMKKPGAMKASMFINARYQIWRLRI